MNRSEEKSTEQLRREWLNHPRYRYRGCAPDVDHPRRAAGNLELTLDAWSGADRDGGEPQREREARQAAAIDVCFDCPVMVQCDVYASSVVWHHGVPRLAEPEGIWGGRTALERHRRLIRSRPETTPAPDRVLRTPQKTAVLKALATCWDPFEVAEAAGLDVRTANWQRSSIVTKLGLPKDASRMRALAAARERGLLDGVEVVADDGSVPAVPPPTKLPSPEPVPVAPVVSVLPRRRRGRVRVIPGQLSFDDALALAPVTSLPTTRRLEAAA
ncbi:helix-turn-helix transcriptional regulator [Streptomyces sp. NPDC003395]